MPDRKLTTQQQMTDHDLLTTLVTTQSLNHQNTLAAIGELKEQLGEMRENQEGQNRALLTQVTDLNTFRATHLTIDNIRRWNTTSETVDKYQDRWKFVLAIWGILSGVMGSVMTLMYYYFQFQKH